MKNEVVTEDRVRDFRIVGTVGRKVSCAHAYTACCQQGVSNSHAFISAGKVINPLNSVITF